MKIMVTGATGFLGCHLVGRLLERGHSIVAVARDLQRAGEMPWIERVELIRCDLRQDFSPLLKSAQLPEALIHLAWSGLRDLRSYSHINVNLPADLAFLEAAVRAGIGHLAVAGTCLEYGIQHGPLAEDAPTAPVTSYGLAKDTLRKSLQLLQREKPFLLQWLRLFYMYGPGQHPDCLLAHLDRAIDNGETVFNMSAGDQLRDYLPVEKVAEYFVLVVEHPQCQGVINCCSGKPVAVVDLVAQHCRDRGSTIRLNRGYYPYPDYEPLAFWGTSTKLAAIGRE